MGKYKNGVPDKEVTPYFVSAHKVLTLACHVQFPAVKGLLFSISVLQYIYGTIFYCQ